MNIKNLLIGTGVFILALFVVIYGFATFYLKPMHEDFCGKNLYSVTNEQDCISAGGVWNQSLSEKDTPKTFPCQQPRECYEEYDNASEQRSLWIFVFSIPLGILLIVVGAYVFGLEHVGAGLMASGLGTFIYGAGGYWRYSDDWIKFLISLIGLVAVIWFAYWLEKKWKK